MSDGSTPATAAELEEAAKRNAECMGVRAHKLQWIWENGIWTDKLRCTTCGTVVKSERFKGQ